MLSVGSERDRAAAPPGAAVAGLVSGVRPAGIEVLGPLVVRVRGAMIEPSAGRQRRLITILAATAGRAEPVSVDELVDALYGEDAPAAARRALKTELWRLRQALGGRAVLTEPAGYRLNLRHCAVDVGVFEEKVAEGRTLLRDGASLEAEQSLAAALALWRGEPLAEWVDHPGGRAVALRLTELHLGVIEDHAEALAAAGRHAQAISALEALIGSEPAREHAWALLVESYLGTGRPRQARRAFDAARRHLAEHGVEVGAELRAAWQRAPAAPADAPRPPALIGRDRQIEAVLGAVRGAMRAARPHAVVIAGEAGIGKSALTNAVAEALGEELAIARVSCDPRLDLPYAALAPLLSSFAERGATRSPILDRLFSGTPARPAGDPQPQAVDAALAEQRALRDAVCAGIEAAARSVDGLVLIVEDAHWATEATLDVLAALLARRAHVPLCLLVSVRDPAAMPPPHAAALAELRRRASEVISLTGLDQAATGLLLGPAGDDPAAVRRAHRLTGGNPLYIGQVSRLDLSVADAAARSASLDGAVEEHLAALSDDVVTVLELAAVAGDRFDMRVLTAAGTALGLAATQVADAMAAAAAAGIVTAGSDETQEQMRFVHSLIRDRLYARVPADRRAHEHAAVGDALRRVSVGHQTPVDLLAHHAFHGWPACPAAAAAAPLRAAGDRAAGQLDFARAGEYYRRALDLIAMEPTFADHAATAELLVASAQAARAVGDLAGAVHAYASLTQLAERHDLPEDSVRAELGLVRMQPGTSDDQAVDRLDRLVRAAAGGLSGSTGRITRTAGWPVLVGESIAAIYPFRPQEGRELLDRAVIALPDAAASLRISVWGQQAVAHQVETARQLTADADADPVSAWLRLWVSEVAAGTRRLDAAPSELAGALGSPQSRWELALWRITVATGTGEFARAERLIAAARERLDHAGGPADAAARSAGLLGQQAWLAVLRGDAAGPTPSRATDFTLWSRRPAWTRAAVAYWHARGGARELAKPVVEELVDELVDGEMSAGDPLARTVVLGQACIELDCLRGIAACRRALAEQAEQHAVLPFVHYFGAVSLYLGRLAAAAGDLNEAVTWLEHAVANHRAAGAALTEAQSRHNLAVALWRRGRAGDRDAANSEREQAAAQADRLGLGSIAQREWPPRPLG